MVKKGRDQDQGLEEELDLDLSQGHGGKIQKGLDRDQGVDCNGNQDLDPDQGLEELDKGLDQDQE